METRMYDALKVKIFPTRDQMGKQAAQEAVAVLTALLTHQEVVNVMFAAAPSQNEVLSALCTADLDWRRINAFHMDEYLGLSEGHPQLFSSFLNRAIFKRVPFQNVFPINPQGKDPCGDYTQLLQAHPLDVVFLGIGENGHLAFNDPPHAKFDETQLVKVVTLEEKCRQQQVNDGCFVTLDAVPTQALTVTIPTLCSGKYLFCVVPSHTKAEAVADCLQAPVSEICPASILRTKPNATLYLDIDSAKLLQ